MNTWGGKLQVHAEPRIPTSEYLLQLDQDPDQESEKRNDDKDEDVEMHPPEASSIRYWSDFNHVYFSEQSIHPLPATTVSPNDSSSIDDVYSDVVTWDESVEAFKRYEVQAELMEGSFRTLVEECDSLQVSTREIIRVIILMI